MNTFERSILEPKRAKQRHQRFAPQLVKQTFLKAKTADLNAKRYHYSSGVDKQSAVQWSANAWQREVEITTVKTRLVWNETTHKNEEKRSFRKVKVQLAYVEMVHSSGEVQLFTKKLDFRSGIIGMWSYKVPSIRHEQYRRSSKLKPAGRTVTERVKNPLLVLDETTKKDRLTQREFVELLQERLRIIDVDFLINTQNSRS